MVPATPPAEAFLDRPPDEQDLFGSPSQFEPGDPPDAMEEDASAPQQAPPDGGMDMSTVSEVSPDEEVIATIINALGCDGKSSRRERKAAAQRILSEVYSPPRITKMLAGMSAADLVPGLALDISCDDPLDGLPWDFSRSEKRDRARSLLRTQRPLFLVGSVMCTAWSSWQQLNAAHDPERHQQALVAARVHLQFLLELYQEQMEGGRYFLHEHPAHASSWTEQMVQDLLAIPGVERSDAEQCQYGASVLSGEHTGSPVKKPTGFCSNSPFLLAALSRRCTGHGGACSRPQGGTHILCEGKVAKDAAIYPPGLCRAIIKGATDQLRHDGYVRPGHVG